MARSLLALVLLFAPAAVAGDVLDVAPFLFGTPFVKGTAWKPVVEVMGVQGLEADTLRRELTTALASELEKAGFKSNPPTRQVTIQNTRGPGVTMSFAPTLRVVVAASKTSSMCQATAHDELPGTRAVGVVWSSPLVWNDEKPEFYKGMKPADRHVLCFMTIARALATSVQNASK